MKFSSPDAPSSSGKIILSDFLDKFSAVQDESDGWLAPCPAHEDGHPSLRVAVNDERALLLHCRAGCSKDAVLAGLGLTKGDLFDVQVGEIERHTAPSVPLSRAHLAPLAAYLDKAAAALQERGEDALRYARGRFGVGAETAKALGLGYDDGAVPHPGLGLSAVAYRADARLVVPFNGFDGNPHGLQARALSKVARTRWSGPVNPKDGSSWAKYGVFRSDSGLPDGEVIVTEGPGDALTAVAVGYDSVCIRGAALGSNSALADGLAAGLRGRRVVVAGDADAAGAKFITAVCEALSSRGVKTHRLSIPAGLSDVTEWREGDPASFAQRFADAVQHAEEYGADHILADRLRVEASHLLTDVHNARSLREYLLSRGADVRYTDGLGFLIYHGHDRGVWERDVKEVAIRTYAHDSTAFLQRRTLTRVHELEQHALSISDPDLRSSVTDAVGRVRLKISNGRLVSWAMSSNGISAMVRELQSLQGVHVPDSVFDRELDKLSVSNGVVNLETGELLPHSDLTRDMYFTVRAETAYVPGARCPRWERFITELFPGQEDMHTYVQRLLGYSITGQTAEQIVVVMQGPGGDGKGVLMNTITKILGDYCRQPSMATFEKKTFSDGGSAASPNVAALAQCRIAVASESERGKPMAEALVKKLSGGDPITARHLWGHEFTFEPRFQMFMVTNHPPVIQGRDRGIWRRLKMIRFGVDFRSSGNVDLFLQAKFAGERVPASAMRPDDDLGDGREGILAWLVRGAVEWYRSGLQEPQTVTRATSSYRDSEDQLLDFITSKLVREEEGRIKGSDLFKLYGDWADEEELAPKDKWTRRTFYGAMEERGFPSYTKDGSKAFRGIRARTPQDPHVNSE